jgi:HEAT repeat protein
VLRTIDDQLAEMEKAIARGDLGRKEHALDSIEDQLRYLGRLGAGAAGAVPRLRKLTHHAEPRMRRSAVAALKRIDMK